MTQYQFPKKEQPLSSSMWKTIHTFYQYSLKLGAHYLWFSPILARFLSAQVLRPLVLVSLSCLGVLGSRAREVLRKCLSLVVALQCNVKSVCQIVASKTSTLTLKTLPPSLFSSLASSWANCGWYCSGTDLLCLKYWFDTILWMQGSNLSQFVRN